MTGVPRGTAVLAGVLLAAGCAAGPRYRWQPPVPVALEDWDACHPAADAAARRQYDRYVDMVAAAGPFGGRFGGVTLGRRAWEEREAVYEQQMTRCLAARGYQWEGAPAGGR